MERTTLGELASWEPPPDEIDYYHRFINVIDEFYPDDWRSWEVNNISYEDLFGDRISSDEENRLRFAVPTLHLAYAFSEGPPSLSERRYKRIKRQLITWPLGRAIIYSPFATMKKIHPTDAGNRFSELLSELKGQLISRAEAAKVLHTTERKFRPPFTMPSTSQKRTYSSGPTPYKKPRNEGCDTMTEFMKQQNVMLQKLCQLSEDQNKTIRLVYKKISNKARRLDKDKSESFDSCDEGSCERSSNQEPTGEIEDDDSAALEAKEIEATRKAADEGLVKQGIACQRLGTDSWQNISYADGQEKFEAAPVFNNLNVNSSLTKITPPWKVVTVLEKMDLCLGAITHGLLQQRKEFQEIYQKATLEVKSVISKYFLSSESSYRQTSDSLLQYTCGRRAEVIQQRRSLYKPSSQIIHELLHSIPPSSTHLFSESKFYELLKEQGGIHKIFPRKIKLKEGKKYSCQTSSVSEKPHPSESYRRPSKVTERPTFSNRRTRNAVKQKT